MVPAIKWSFNRKQLLAIVAIAFMLGNSLFSFVGWSAVQPDNSTQQDDLWGLVYAKGARPGDEVSMSVVTDTKKIENIADLDVIFFERPKPSQTTSGSGQTQTVASADGVALDKVSVDLGDGPQPANKPIIKKIPWNAALLTANIVLTALPKVSLGGGTIPLDGKQTSSSVSSVAHGPVNATYHMPQFVTPGSVTAIQGPISGNAEEMSATLNGQAQRIIAAIHHADSARPDETFIDVPKTLPPSLEGSTQDTWQFAAGDGLPTRILHTGRASLELHAGRTMITGETEEVTLVVNLTGVNDWRFGAPSSSLVKTDAINAIKGLQKDATSNRGGVIVIVRNLNPDVLQMPEVAWILHEKDAPNGVATKKIRIRAIKQGHWALQALLIPELSESSSVPAGDSLTGIKPKPTAENAGPRSGPAPDKSRTAETRTFNAGYLAERARDERPQSAAAKQG